MRLLHPKILEIVANRPDLPKTIISHAWSEVFKFKGSGQKHPKMFIDDDYDLGVYLGIVYWCGEKHGCKLDKNKIFSLNNEIQKGFTELNILTLIEHFDSDKYFNDNYLFSDLCSLYYKGYNLFPNVFGDDWRKYVPVESLKEIKRQVDKTISKCNI